MDRRLQWLLAERKFVSSCALVSGGATGRWKKLLKRASTVVTGNFDEPAWHMAFEGSINFFALGHAATEKVGPRAVADYLRRIHNLDAVFLDELNPF